MRKRLAMLMIAASIFATTPVSTVMADETVTDYKYEDKHLTKRGGVHVNDQGYKETYYNLRMDKVVSIMRKKGYREDIYPYWVRDDGCKMLGDFIMVAADLSKHPKGSVVYTSLGWGIVVDTGSAIKGARLDIATNW